MAEERKPKREKPKRKRKRDESILPYVAIFAVVIVLIVGVAGIFLLRIEPEPDCTTPGPDCEFTTPTLIPNPLFPTPTPVLPPDQVSQQPPVNIPMVSSLALSPDEKYLLISLKNPYQATVEGEIVSMHLTQSDKGQPTFTEDMSQWQLTQTQLHAVDDMDIHPDGDFFTLASSLNPYVEIYDISLDDISLVANEPPAHAPYSDAAFSPDGQYAAMAGTQGVGLYDASSFHLLSGPEQAVPVDMSDASSPLPHIPMVVDLVFNNASTALVVARDEVMTDNMGPYLEIWQIEDGSLGTSQPVSISRQITDIAAHPTLNQVAIAMPGQIDIYDLDSQQHESYPLPDVLTIASLDYHPDGHLLAFGGSQDLKHGSWHAIPLDDEGFAIPTDGGINLNSMGFVSGPVSQVLYNGSGATLFVGTTNGLLFAWDAFTGRSYDQYSFVADMP